MRFPFQIRNMYARSGIPASQLRVSQRDRPEPAVPEVIRPTQAAHRFLAGNHLSRQDVGVDVSVHPPGMQIPQLGAGLAAADTVSRRLDDGGLKTLRLDSTAAADGLADHPGEGQAGIS